MRTDLLLTVAAAALLPQVAFAEDAPSVPPPPAAEQANADGQLQEIVVTAQKRSQSVNSVSMSVTAVSGDALKARGITDVGDITRIEPSFQFAASQHATPVYTIRGIGYFEQSLAATPTVSVYQDEVPFALPVMTTGTLLDPERVEVLKGPQGTLFGQNATGGAINFIAAKPTSTLAAGVDASIERFNRTRIEGYISGPLSSTLKARLAGSIEQGGAWQKSRTRDDRLGDKNKKIARLILDWKPTDRFSASLNLNGWTDNSEIQALQLEDVRFASPQFISPNSLTPLAANFLPNAAYFNTYPNEIKALLAQPRNPTSNRQADWAPGTRPHADEDFYQASLRLNYELTDAISLTSLTSYQHYRQKNKEDEGGVGIPYAVGNIYGNARSFFQELRLNGSLDNKGSWLVGINYAKDKSYEDDYFSPLLSSVAFLTGGSLFSPLQIRPFEFGARNKVDATTKSAFAHLEYPIIDTVSFNGGIRYTDSRQDFATCSYGDVPLTIFYNATAQSLAAAFGGPVPTPVQAGQCVTLSNAPFFQPGVVNSKLDEHNVAWRAGLDWKPSRRMLFYISASKGFKAGTAPALGATEAVQLIPIKQESLLSYEIGAKMTLLNGRLQLNGAAFHYDYSNKQVLGRIIDPLGVFGAVQTLVNIPKSKVDGFEATADWLIASGLRLNAAVTYLDSKVSKDFINYSPYLLNAADTVNFKGEPFPYTPKWSVQYGARYDWALNDTLGAFVGGNASYQSKTVGVFGSSEAVRTTGAPPLTVKAYSLFDANAGVQTDKWRLEIFVKNIANKYYWQSAFWDSDNALRVSGMPRTYGLRLHYSY